MALDRRPGKHLPVEKKLMMDLRSMSLLACVLAALGATAIAAEPAHLPPAYPAPIPEDASFDTVVKTHKLPAIRYPVPIIGWKEHPEEVHVTPSGALVFPRAAAPGGLYLNLLLENDKHELAALPDPDKVRSKLVEGYMPGVENAWTVRGIELRQLAFCRLLEGREVRSGRESLLAFVRYTLANTGAETKTVKLGLRFGQARGGHSLKQIPPTYPAALSWAAPFLVGPDASVHACILSGDLKISFATSKPAGAAPSDNCFTIELVLEPRDTKSVELIVPFFPLPRDEAAALPRLIFDRELSAFQDFWRWELNRNAEFIVPEERVRNAYRACLAYNLLLTDHDPQSGFIVPHPDATGYEAAWAGDGAVIVQAMDRLRYHQEASAYLSYFLSRQGARKPDGDVSSAEGCFSGDAPPKWMGDDGFILWAMAEHYKLSGDEIWLRKAAPALIKGCDWIVRERARTKQLVNGQKPPHFGLLPKGNPSDLGVWDHWYWTDTYSYMGLRGVADVLATTIYTEDAKRLAAEAADYRACIQEAVQKSIVREGQPPFVPPSPYHREMPTWESMQKTWYTICSPIYMVEAGLMPPRSQEADWTCTWLERHGLYAGLAAYGQGGIDPFYVYNQSLTQLLRGESSKFVWSLYSLCAYGMSRGTYATLETNNLVTGAVGEAWDTNRQPHMHSNSRFLDMVRIALVLEEGPKLHLLAGTPRGWLADGKTITIQRAPTYFGEVKLEARSDGFSREIRVRVDPPSREHAEIVLHVRPPSAWGKIKSVQVDGKPWTDFSGEEVRLGKLRCISTVLCSFQKQG